MEKNSHTDSSTGEWNFNIDLEAIRAEADAEKQREEEETRSLMAQIDALTDTSSLSEETDDSVLNTSLSESTRGLDSDLEGSAESESSTENEKTVVIPTASVRNNQSARSSSTNTRPASSARPRYQQTVNSKSESRKTRSIPQKEKPLTRKEIRAAKKREKRLARVEKSRQRPKFRFAPVLASLLAITNVVTLGALGLNYIQTSMTVQNAKQSVADAQAEAESAQSQLSELQKNSISLETFTYNVAEYNISTEFIQEFFDDKIVYKDTSVHYADIDETLPKNSFDFSIIKWENGRPSYKPDGERHASLGVDVSYHQGDIDWDAVKADGIDFAIIRCGYRGYGTGDLVEDSCYSGNVTGAVESGLDVGVYFFSQAITTDEAVEEADYVLSLIDGKNITMPIVFDMEILDDDARANDLTSAQRAEITCAFCDRIKEAGYTPMIYGNTAYYMSKIDYDQIASNYSIWIAQYYEKPFFPYQMSMWQYTSTGTVDGISGSVDISLYFGS